MSAATLPAVPPVVTEHGDRVTLTATCRVMANDARVVAVVAGPRPDARIGSARRAVRAGVERLAELERRWSRFRPDSDVSVLGRHGGTAVAVAPETVTLVVALVEAWWATAGAFDPTLLGALRRLGDATAPDGPVRGRPDAIEVDRRAGAVRLPPGTTLDAGGMGKGLAADLVVADLLAAGVDGALVEVGGDLRAHGTPPDPRGWAVDVEDPLRPGAGPIRRLLLRGGAIATSGTVRRRWTAPDGTQAHHLIDPATSAPSHTPLVAATVVAGTGAWAEAWATAVLVAAGRGDRHLAELLHRLDADGLAVMGVAGDGRVVENDTWRRFEPATTPPTLRHDTGATRWNR